jgi:hypothetical protein
MIDENLLIKFEEVRGEYIAKYKKAKIASLVFLILALIGLGFVIFYLVNDVEGTFQVALMIDIFLFALSIFTIRIGYLNVNGQYKRMIAGKVKKAVYDANYGENKYIIDSSRGLSLPYLMDSSLFKKPDRFSSSDFFQTTKEGVKIMSSRYVSTFITYYRDSKGNLREVRTDYPGRVICFEIPRDLKFSLCIAEKHSVGGAFSYPVNFGGKIQFESIDFNKKFETFCPSMEDAFYLITPELMIDFLDFDKKYDSKLLFVLKGYKIFLFMGGYNEDFKVSFLKPISEEKLEPLVRQISLPLTVYKDLGLSESKFTDKDL